MTDTPNAATVKRYVVEEGQLCSEAPWADGYTDLAHVVLAADYDALAERLVACERDSDEALRMLKNLAPIGRYNGLAIEGWYQRATTAEAQLAEARELLSALAYEGDEAARAFLARTAPEAPKPFTEKELRKAMAALDSQVPPKGWAEEQVTRWIKEGMTPKQARDWLEQTGIRYAGTAPKDKP